MLEVMLLSLLHSMRMRKLYEAYSMDFGPATTNTLERRQMNGTDAMQHSEFFFIALIRLLIMEDSLLNINKPISTSWHQNWRCEPAARTARLSLVSCQTLIV